MTATPRSVPRARTLAATCAAALLGAGMLAGCGSDGTATSGTTPGAPSSAPSTAGTTADPAAALTVEDAWVKAAPGGMTAFFGLLRNTGGSEITVTSGRSPAAAAVELHEVAMSGGAMTMRPKAGGFVVPAGGTHVLAPGGDHLMLIGLTGPVAAGQAVRVTLTTSGGATVEATGIAKEFAAGNETYAPSGGTGMSGSPAAGSPGTGSAAAGSPGSSS